MSVSWEQFRIAASENVLRCYQKLCPLEQLPLAG